MTLTIGSVHEESERTDTEIELTVFHDASLGAEQMV